MLYLAVQLRYGERDHKSVVERMPIYFVDIYVAMPTLPAWHKDYVPDEAATCPYFARVGRRPYQIPVKRLGVSHLIDSGVVSRDFVEAHTPDQLRFPTVERDGLELLDVTRIAQELCNGQEYCTVVVSRDCLVKLHDLCVVANDLPKNIMCEGDFNKMRFDALVGSIFPVIGPVSHQIKDHGKAFDPIDDGDSGRDHSFAFRPTVIGTTGEKGKSGDQGEVVAQGIVVSSRAFNFLDDDDRRLTLGMNPRFEDNMCWVLITHAYAPYVPYSKMNKESTKKRRRSDDDPFETIFKWEAYRAHNKDLLKEPGWKISSFGLLDTKQTGKLLVRAMVPWTIQEVGAELHRLRTDNSLHSYLLSVRMTQPKDATSFTDRRSKGGMDLRRMLMCEYLLQGTPLEPLLRATESLDIGMIDVPVRTPEEMFRSMKEHADAHFAT